MNMAVLQGTAADDIIRGTGAIDALWGLAGADVFYWGSGRGNDTIHGGDIGDRYDANPYTPGNPGGDRLMLLGSEGARVTFSSTEAGSVRIGNAMLQFNGIERLFGSRGGDVIDGSAARLNAAHDGTPQHGLSIFARGGHDRITGSAFDDVMDGGRGNDTIQGGAGNDFVHSSTGHDLIYGGAGGENIRWGSGNNEHNPGNDTIYGGADYDLINVWIKDGDIYPSNEAKGIRGASVIIDAVRADGSFDGRAYSDIGGAATLRFYEMELAWTHAGNDTFTAANATVAAGGRGVNLNARWGHDSLIGSRGNDTLVGDDGKDTISGGAGNDALWIGHERQGDGDRDVLLFRAGDGQDTVFGFEAGRDVLDLNGRDYTARETDAGTVLNLGGGDTILLSGVFDFI